MESKNIINYIALALCIFGNLSVAQALKLIENEPEIIEIIKIVGIQ